VLELLRKGGNFLDLTGMNQRPIGPQPDPSPEKIEALVAEQQQSSKSPTASSTPYTSMGVNGLLKSRIAPLEWLIPGMIPKGSTVSLGGTSNVGKTRWLASLCVLLATGKTEMMGLPVVEVPARILWVANEERVDDIRRRCKAVALQHGLKGGLNWVVRGKDEGMLQLVSLNENGQPELNAEAIATLVAEIRKAGADAFVMDPYVTISNAVDENSAVSATMITKGLNIVTQMTGAVAIHAHHTPKSRNDDGDWYRGSSDAWRGSGAIFSALDCAFTLSHFIPLTKDQRKAWKALTLSGEEEMPTPDHSEG
jgi:RecA-family ATPase